MRYFRRLPVWFCALVCLPGTGSGVAWADRAQDEHWAESPYAPHVTKGATARVGTVVGHVNGQRVDVTALGLATAVGQRFGRLAIESEYTYLGFQERGPSSLRLGTGHRLGVIGRFDVIRIGPRYVGGNSLMSMYVEGGAGVAWNRWSRPAYSEHNRIIPEDTQRAEAQVGFGIQLDHRLQEPIGFPRRIGWTLGWRLALAPHEAEPAVVCRGVSCRPAPMMSDEDYTDTSMLFQSSLAVTW